MHSLCVIDLIVLSSSYSPDTTKSIFNILSNSFQAKNQADINQRQFI